ncbi:MAG TPA: hypothetical protein VG871_24210 [Vicinamibacterales bacterium]|nr:hypothetical protein [Vicinamibacterales bacterium]
MSTPHMVVKLKRPPPNDGFPHPEFETPGPDRGPFLPRRLWIAAAVVIACLAAFVGYRWFGSHPASASSADPNATSTAEEQAAAREVQDIVARVGRLIELPEGETPTVATVTDPDKLADQPFFANAKKGDDVLLYTKAKKAYLYDPAADKLVDVAPITDTAQ